MSCRAGSDPEKAIQNGALLLKPEHPSSEQRSNEEVTCVQHVAIQIAVDVVGSRRQCSCGGSQSVVEIQSREGISRIVFFLFLSIIFLPPVLVGCSCGTCGLAQK